MRVVSKATAGSRLYAKPAATASGSMCDGHAQSSSNRLSKNGHSIRWRVVPGRENTMKLSELAARVTRRRSAVSLLSGFVFSSDAGRIGRRTMRAATRKGLYVDLPHRTPVCESCGKTSLVFQNRHSFRLDFLTQMSPMVFGIIPECRSAFLRIECSASPESPNAANSATPP